MTAIHALLLSPQPVYAPLPSCPSPSCRDPPVYDHRLSPPWLARFTTARATVSPHSFTHPAPETPLGKTTCSFAGLPCSFHQNLCSHIDPNLSLTQVQAPPLCMNTGFPLRALFIFTTACAVVSPRCVHSPMFIIPPLGRTICPLLVFPPAVTTACLCNPPPLLATHPCSPNPLGQNHVPLRVFPPAVTTACLCNPPPLLATQPVDLVPSPSMPSCCHNNLCMCPSCSSCHSPSSRHPPG